MTDFDYDCRQKKILARSAYRRKNGSRSKRCSLPSDRLTPKQRNEMNGKVVSYNMKVPMQWEEFKQLPTDIKDEYIRSLMQSYHATSKVIAEMLGVAPETLSRCLREECPEIVFTRGRKMNRQEQEAWAGFLNQVPRLIDSVPAEDVQVETTEQQEPEQKTRMDGFSIRFHGELDLNQIMNSIRYILGPGPVHGEIEIRCSGLSD